MGANGDPDIRLTTNGNMIFGDAMLQQERAKLEQLLTIRENQISKGEAFIRPWYPSERKFLKSKLGSLF